MTKEQIEAEFQKKLKDIIFSVEQGVKFDAVVFIETYSDKGPISDAHIDVSRDDVLRLFKSYLENNRV